MNSRQLNADFKEGLFVKLMSPLNCFIQVLSKSRKHYCLPLLHKHYSGKGYNFIPISDEVRR